MMASGGYVCSLDEESVARAKEMLNEIPEERLSSVNALRDWTQKQKWLSCPTDSLFLLSFLRVCKFSQLRARKRLTNFLVSLDDSVRYLKGIKPGEKKYQDILRQSLVFTPLPKPDSKGRIIILGNYDNFDPSGQSYSYEDFQRSILSLCHSLVFFNESVQVNGVVFLMDYGSVTLRHLSFGGTENIKKRSIHFQKALPVQMKMFHHYNNGPIFDVLVKIIKPTLTEKMRPRVKTHGHSMVSVYKHIDMSLLPDEYLPDDYDGPSAGSLAEITEGLISEYLLDPVKQAFLTDLYSGRYYADTTNTLWHEDENASFRMLSVS